MNILLQEWEHKLLEEYRSNWQQWIEENETNQEWVSFLNNRMQQLDLNLQQEVDDMINSGELSNCRDAFFYYHSQWKLQVEWMELEKYQPKEIQCFPPIFEHRSFVATRLQVMSESSFPLLLNWTFERPTCFARLLDRKSKVVYECYDLYLEDVYVLCYRLFEICPVQLIEQGCTLTKIDTRLQMMHLVKLIGDQSVLPIEMGQQ